jgi:ketosteroid isomerase-like protein
LKELVPVTMEASMHPNARLVHELYACFGRRDVAGMLACYAPDVEFTDVIFRSLKRQELGHMWQMLLERTPDLEVSVYDVRADDEHGSARWEAHYTFGVTGRRVHNVVDASFRFRDRQIIWHEDRFDLWRWAGMALGAKGKAFGWFPLMRNAVRKQARRRLEHFSETLRSKSQG